jgi:hypothetical protein
MSDQPNVNLFAVTYVAVGEREQTWETAESFAHTEIIPIVATGFVLQSDANVVVIAAERISEPQVAYRSTLVIPRTCVLSMTPLINYQRPTVVP